MVDRTWFAKPEIMPKGDVRVQFTIRDYLPEDFQKLWEIDRLCFPQGIAYSRYELGVYVRRRNAFTLVAEDNVRIIGFLVADLSRKRIGHIITIDVLAQARKHRVGSSLLQAAEQRLQSLNGRIIYLETAVDNSPAIAFYKRHGYDVVETIPRYYSNGVDALVFAKNLEKHLPAPASSR